MNTLLGKQLFHFHFGLMSQNECNLNRKNIAPIEAIPGYYSSIHMSSNKAKSDHYASMCAITSVCAVMAA